MTGEERNALAERLTDIFLLSLETVVENFAKVVAGEKRIAVVPRKNQGLKTFELRLSTPKALQVQGQEAWRMTPDELAAIGEDDE